MPQANNSFPGEGPNHPTNIHHPSIHPPGHGLPRVHSLVNHHPFISLTTYQSKYTLYQAQDFFPFPGSWRSRGSPSNSLYLFYFRTTPSYQCPPADYSGDGVVRNKDWNSHMTARRTWPDVWERINTCITSRCAEHGMTRKSHPDKQLFQKAVMKLLEHMATYALHVIMMYLCP